jgi:hypothetical protein
VEYQRRSKKAALHGSSCSTFPSLRKSTQTMKKSTTRYTQEANSMTVQAAAAHHQRRKRRRGTCRPCTRPRRACRGA